MERGSRGSGMRGREGESERKRERDRDREPCMVRKIKYI